MSTVGTAAGSAPDGLEAPGGAHTSAGAEAVLLSSVEVARFVTDGFLVMEGLIPPEVSAAVLAEIADGRLSRGWPSAPTDCRAGAPLDGLWSGLPGMGAVLGNPRVRGAIQSLVGARPSYDHHAVHTIPAGTPQAQPWHQDSTIDARSNFDVQVFYYPQDTPREMGGTMLLPGSHLRLIHEFEAAVHQNFVGQRPMVCPAGTVMVAHHGIWHCGQPNRTGTTRHMVKLRLNPAGPQVRLWDTSDLGSEETTREVAQILGTIHPWHGVEHRIEIIQRIRLWRLLAGDPTFDFARWMGRLEATSGAPPRYS